mgnify:CR=1 FL=1
MNENEMLTWRDDDFGSKENALAKFSDNVDAYNGVHKTQGNHYRHFIDIEPNRSVRPGFNPSDYHAFRPDEAVPQQQRRVIKMCMDAYDKVGIIRNIIDLMGDFGSQGITTTGVISMGNGLTLTGTNPFIDIIDSNNNSDFTIKNDNGTFEIEDKTNSNAVRLAIDSSGRVGIGTTSPDNLLHIESSSNTYLLVFSI